MVIRSFGKSNMNHGKDVEEVAGNVVGTGIQSSGRKLKSKLLA
jgi:hypothetical protein